MVRKILLAEDEKELARAVSVLLKYEGYDVEIVYNGEEALDKALNEVYDIMIFDIMMPIMDGITALKMIRENNINTPVLLLTAKSQIDDKVEGLDAGANDYLTKPFNKKELLARIRALTRTKEENNYEIGNIIFNKTNSEISSPTATFHLNNKECEIMEFLLKNQEKNISKNELKKRIWNEEAEEDETIVTMYVSYLQEKFQALGANIKINYDQGYCLERIL